MKEIGIKLELDGKKVKQYLQDLHAQMHELRDLIKFAEGESWKWLCIMTGIVVVNVVAGFFHDLVWVDLVGTILAVIAFLFHIHWEGKVKMLKGARGGMRDAISMLIKIGVGDKVKAAFHSLLSTIEKIGEPEEKKETPAPAAAPAKKRVMKKIPVKREKK